ncbi:MAG: right-handed parallel beta-helix repeat-containing protein, partial [Sandaracinaceae bacterium]
GFGALATGASPSDPVYHVTNLNSSGSGSLANGIGSHRTIVFDVGGTIHSTRLDLIGVSYLTILGSTAPSPGITLDNRSASGGGGPGGDVVSFDGASTHHAVLEGVRTIHAGNDGINVLDGAHDIVITNCSSYDNADGNIDVAGGDHVTVQYCIMGPSATGGPGPMLITAQNVTVHHNLFSPRAPSTPGERCPLVHCNYTPVGNPNADIVNNLIWRFGRDDGSGSGFGIDIAYGAAANAVGNYAYTTGSSPDNGVTRGAYGEPTGSLYASGNQSGNPGIDANADSNHAPYPIPSQYAVTTSSACTAARDVLANAGPAFLDAREQTWVMEASALPRCP